MQHHKKRKTHTSSLKTKKGGEKRMRRELLNQGLMYAIVGLFALLVIPVIHYLA